MITKIIGDKEYRLTISPDEYISPPREDDNLGVFIMSHRSYKLGDEELTKHGNNLYEDFLYHINSKYSIIDPESDYGLLDDEVKSIEKFIEDNILYRDVYMYDHSGISLSTRVFGCRWDSGQVGYIYVNKNRFDGDYPLQEGETKESKLLSILDDEIKTLSQYCSGKIYQYIIGVRYILEKDGKTFYTELETEDSCGGFYSIEDMNGYIDKDIFTIEEILSCEITY